MQLIEELDHIGSLLDGAKQTDIIYMDISIAFEKVNHNILLKRQFWYLR